jgi:hypothetical protein
LAFEHKHGVNQIVHAQRMFAHQVAGEVIAAQAARAVGREGGGHVCVWGCLWIDLLKCQSSLTFCQISVNSISVNQI